ncbi:hypothetical protein LTR84_008566 [Exophiala bonariae]|uniref:Major facilitator superfamily (MFS) profile domain-containing protein n=1 Tax=Exophiala bonariae TaxID=1690606 RepID=A0AAV9MWZ9_9EURO|nr:hypothetical protein LTR84_008566 [Exophiala bonariae]
MAEKESSQPSMEHHDYQEKGKVDGIDHAALQSIETMGQMSDAYKTLERRVVRKLDCTLVPMLWIMYLFNYLDRNNIAQARLNSFEKDLGLKGNQFNIALHGYATTLEHATVSELALRTAILYSGLILATAFSGLLAAGIFSGLDQVKGLAGWQWLFILEGAGCFLISMIALVVLPDFPGQKTGSARWLFSDEERTFLAERIKKDRVSEDEIDRSVWTGLRAALLDIKTWLFTLTLTLNHSAYGFNNFFPTIVKGFGFGNNTITLILTAPPYLLAAFVAFGVARSSDRRKERGWHIAIPTIFSCIGFIISVATLNRPARYTAAFLYIAGCFSSNALIFSWASNSLSQSPEKRACATAVINVLSQLGNIWSPYFFPSDQGPRYTMAMLLMMASTVGCGLTAISIKWLLIRANRRLEQSGATIFFSL